MRQAHQQQVETVELRVVAERFMEQESRGGPIKLVPAPWSHKLRHNGKEYLPGDKFSVPRETANQLLLTGAVQLASTKAKPFMPPSLDRKVNFVNGVKLREEVAGKTPTREGDADKDAPWEDDDEDL